MDDNEQKIEKDENFAEEIVGTKTKNAELENKEMRAMSSSSMDNKNASDEEIGSPPKKKAKKSIKFGGWLPDCLDWFKRPELAQSSLSTSSYTMNRYCWPHLHGRKVKPHIVERLTFIRARAHDDEGNRQILRKGKYWLQNYRTIPIADIKPPEYIIGFKQIGFRFAEDRSLQFLGTILPLLKEGIILILNNRSFNYEARRQIVQIKRLLELVAPKIRKFHILGTDSHSEDDPTVYSDLKDFSETFPGFIYGIQTISLSKLSSIQSFVDMLVKWLNTPMEDGKPRMLLIRYIDYDALIDALKEEFSNSIEPVNFIIRLFLNPNEKDGTKNFKIENEKTGEMLEFDLKRDKPFLIRYKNDEIKTEMENKLEEEFKMNLTMITLP